MPYVQHEFCDGCGATPDGINDLHIQKCAKCQIGQYCSKKCQSKMWKSLHKTECRKPEEVVDVLDPRYRDKGRYGLCDHDRNIGPDTIWYIRVTRPYVHNLYIYGPFHSIEATYVAIARSLRFSKWGMTVFLDLCARGKVHKLDHILAPIDADFDNLILVELFPHENARLKAVLPCPVFNVMTLENLQPPQYNAIGHALLKDMELVRTCLTLEEAIAAVEKKVEFLSQKEPGRKGVADWIGGKFTGGIMKDDVLLYSVNITYDMGKEMPHVWK